MCDPAFLIHASSAGPNCDSQFVQALAQSLGVAEVPGRNSGDSDGNLRPCPNVFQSGEPLAEDIFSGSGDVAADFDHG